MFLDKNHTSGILVRPISDHQMYFCIMNENFVKSESAHKYIEVELCNQDNIEKFIKEVSDANIYDHFNPALNTNPNYNYKIVSELLQTAKSRHIPKKVRKFNKRKHMKEKWMTRELLTEVVKKTKLYVEWKTTSVTHVNYDRNKQRFKEHEKETLKKIREAKKEYFDRIFTAYKADIKKTWKAINETLNRNKNGSELPSRFLNNDVEILDPKDIANTFNEYFENIGKNFASEIDYPDNNNGYKQYLHNLTEKRLKFKCITESETTKVIEGLENKTSSGHDGISNKLLKLIQDKVSKPLTLIINQMLTTGIFPDAFKKSKIVPIFKKGDSSLPTNYRPISILPTISKIFERVIYNQLYEYFNTNNLLAEEQYGFRTNHSTEYAAIKLVDHLSKEMDIGNIP